MVIFSLFCEIEVFCIVVPICDLVHNVETFSPLLIAKSIFLTHLSRRLVVERLVYPWSSVRLSSTFSNMNISATSGPITMKFYQKHHWDGGNAALGFGPNQIKTLVSMATDSSHRVIMEKNGVATFSQLSFIRCFLYLQVMMTCMGARRSSKFSQIRQPTAELAALERLKKSP